MLDAERLAAAMNDAQIDPREIALGRDLRVVADRIAQKYEAALDSMLPQEEGSREDGAFVDWFLGEYGIDPIGEDWKRLRAALAAASPSREEPSLQELAAEIAKDWNGRPDPTPVIAELRDALRDANAIVDMTRDHLRRDHPECAYDALGILNDESRPLAAASPSREGAGCPYCAAWHAIGHNEENAAAASPSREGAGPDEAWAAVALRSLATRLTSEEQREDGDG